MVKSSLRPSGQPKLALKLYVGNYKADLLAKARVHKSSLVFSGELHELWSNSANNFCL
jgi:hypothetical protein